MAALPPDVRKACGFAETVQILILLIAARLSLAAMSIGLNQSR